MRVGFEPRKRVEVEVAASNVSELDELAVLAGVLGSRHPCLRIVRDTPSPRAARGLLSGVIGSNINASIRSGKIVKACPLKRANPDIFDCCIRTGWSQHDGCGNRDCEHDRQRTCDCKDSSYSRSHRDVSPYSAFLPLLVISPRLRRWRRARFQRSKKRLR